MKNMKTQGDMFSSDQYFKDLWSAGHWKSSTSEDFLVS
jgi:hypothetical protein